MKQIVKANFRVPAAVTFVAADVDVVNNRVRISNHGLSVGQPIAFSAGATLPAGLVIDTAYYAIVPNGSQIGFATSRANAFAGTAVDITTVGTGTQTLIPNSFGTILLPTYIPVNALVTNAYYDVITTFTSVTADAAVIALQITSANDLVAGLSIATAGDIWDAGIRGTLAGAGTTTLAEAGPNTRTRIVNAADIAAGSLLVTADSQPAVVVTTDVLTAGELNLFIEYVFSATSA